MLHSVRSSLKVNIQDLPIVYKSQSNHEHPPTLLHQSKSFSSSGIALTTPSPFKMSSQPVLQAWRRDMIFTDAAFEYVRAINRYAIAQPSPQAGSQMNSWATECKKQSSSMDKFMFDIREKPAFIMRAKEQVDSLRAACTAWKRELPPEILGRPDEILEQVRTVTYFREIIDSKQIVTGMEGVVVEYEKAISKAETQTEKEFRNDLALASLLLSMKLNILADVLEGVAAEKITFGDVVLILPEIVGLDDQCIVAP
jgi:hypothetical protein